MLPTKFWFIWPSGFGEDLKKSNDAEIYDNIEFYTANIEGLTQELETLKGIFFIFF
jgi:hypothetical protein